MTPMGAPIIATLVVPMIRCREVGMAALPRLASVREFFLELKFLSGCTYIANP